MVAVCNALLLSVYEKKRGVGFSTRWSSDIDDGCVDTGGRLRREGLRKKKWRCQVDGDGALEACGRQSFDVVGFELASVIDQKSELAKCRGRGNKAAHCFLFGEIGKHHTGASAGSRDCLCKPLGILARIVCMQDHCITCPRKCECDRRPDPAAGAGDQGRARRMLCPLVRHRSNNSVPD